MALAQLITMDRRIRDAVLQQLEWEPAVDASAIGVVARNGVVTLTGYVDSLREKLAAERTAKGLRGVRAVANDLEVRPLLERTHADMAADAVHALEVRGTVPLNVQAAVHDGHITLTGRVAQLFHKTEAEAAVRGIMGVRGIHNHIEVITEAKARDVRHRIVEALHRSADVDAKRVFVTVTGTVAMLKGSVATWRQREAAERAAADAPGITRVDNRITVEPIVEPIEELC